MAIQFQLFSFTTFCSASAIPKHRRREVLFSVCLNVWREKKMHSAFILFCFLVLFAFFEMDFASSGEL